MSRRVTVQRIASDRGAARRGAGQRRRHALPIRYCPRRTVSAIAKDNFEIQLRISHPDSYPRFVSHVSFFCIITTVDHIETDTHRSI